MITRASLRTDADPGHGGLSSDFEIARDGEALRVSARLSRYAPSPGEHGFEPAQWSTVLPKEASEIETFLGRLLDAHGVFALGELLTGQALLHPTFYTFHFEDDADRIHEFRYRIEAGKHLDPRYADLVREFDTFFDKRRLVESFLEAVERRAPPPPRPWWKVW